MQYQCRFCSSQCVHIKTCAKGTNSPSTAPGRDGGETRGRCATMEKQNKMHRCIVSTISIAVPKYPTAQIEVTVAKRDLGKKATARARERIREKILFLMLPSAACAGPCCCRVVCFPVVSLHCDCFSLETSSVFSRVLVLCILPYHCRLCE